MELKSNNAFMELMDIRGMGLPEEGEVTISGSDPFYASPFKIGETSAGILAARAVAAADLWELRTERRQKIHIDVNAAATSMGGISMTRKKNEQGVYEGIPTSPEMEHMVSLTQPWEAKNGRWFLRHTNLPHLEKRVLGVLGCEGTPEAFKEAVSR